MTSEVESVQYKTLEEADEDVDMTSEEDAKIDMLQWARNEFYKNRKIVVKHVQDITPEQVKLFFESFDVKEININKKCHHVIITLTSIDMVDQAVETLNGQIFLGRPAVVRHNPCNRLLCVANLPFDMDDKGFEKLMQFYGKIERCFLMRDHDGSTKGYGFVEFALSRDEVLKISQRLNGHRLESGNVIHSEIMRDNLVKYDQLNPTCIFIGNLPKDYSDDESLRAICSQISAPLFCRVAKKDGCPVGFAIVEFAEWQHAADTCQKLSGFVIDGHTLDVQLCFPGQTAPEAFGHYLAQLSPLAHMGIATSALKVGEFTTSPVEVDSQLVSFLKSKFPLVLKHFRHLLNNLYRHEAEKQIFLMQPSILGESPLSICAQLTRLNNQISLLSVHIASQVQQLMPFLNNMLLMRILPGGYNMAAMFGNPTVVQSIQMIQAMLAKGIDYNDFEDCDDNVADNDLSREACQIDTNTGEDVAVSKQSEIGTNELSCDGSKTSAVAVTDKNIPTAVASSDTSLTTDAKASATEVDVESAAAETEESAAASSDNVKKGVKIPSLLDAFNQHGKQFSSKSIGVLDLADVTRVLCHLQKCLVQNRLTKKVEKQATGRDSELKKEALQSTTGSNIVDDALGKSVAENAVAIDATVEDCTVDKAAVLDDDITQASGTDETHSTDKEVLGPRPLMSLSLSHTRSLPRQKQLFIVNPVLASHFEIQLHQQMLKSVRIGFSVAGNVSRPIMSLCPSFSSGFAGLMPSPIIRPLLPSYPKQQKMLDQQIGDFRSGDTETPGNREDETESSISKTEPAKKNIPSLLTLSVPVGGTANRMCVPSRTAMSGLARMKNEVSNIRPLFGAPYKGTATPKKSAPSAFSLDGDVDNCDSSTEWPSVQKSYVPSLFGLADVNGKSGPGRTRGVRGNGRGLGQVNTYMGNVSSIKPLLSEKVIPGQNFDRNEHGFGPQQFDSETVYGAFQQNNSSTAFQSRSTLRGKNLSRGGGANSANVYSKPSQPTVSAADWSSDNGTYEDTVLYGYGNTNSGMQPKASNNGKWERSVASIYKQKEQPSAQMYYDSYYTGNDSGASGSQVFNKEAYSGDTEASYRADWSYSSADAGDYHADWSYSSTAATGIPKVSQSGSSREPFHAGAAPGYYETDKTKLAGYGDEYSHSQVAQSDFYGTDGYEVGSSRYPLHETSESVTDYYSAAGLPSTGEENDEYAQMYQQYNTTQMSTDYAQSQSDYVQSQAYGNTAKTNQTASNSSQLSCNGQKRAYASTQMSGYGYDSHYSQPTGYYNSTDVEIKKTRFN